MSDGQTELCEAIERERRQPTMRCESCGRLGPASTDPEDRGCVYCGYNPDNPDKASAKDEHDDARRRDAATTDL